MADEAKRGLELRKKYKEIVAIMFIMYLICPLVTLISAIATDIQWKKANLYNRDV